MTYEWKGYNDCLEIDCKGCYRGVFSSLTELQISQIQGAINGKYDCFKVEYIYLDIFRIVFNSSERQNIIYNKDKIKNDICHIIYKIANKEQKKMEKYYVVISQNINDFTDFNFTVRAKTLTSAKIQARQGQMFQDTVISLYLDRELKTRIAHSGTDQKLINN